jgi:DNA helicase-2/ATP-dependent DNA helicase PcrA
VEKEILKDLNPEQKKAVTFGQGPFLIIAGAGTGKTTVITKRIAWLILSKKAKPEEILAVTFTEKAAGEMEERVDRLLPMGYLELWISTFHSFGERILKNHALEIGLPDDFKLLNQTEQNLLIRQNFDRFNLDYYRPLGNPTKFISALVKHFSRAKDEEVWPEDYLEYVKELKLNEEERNEVTKLRSYEVTKLKEIEEIKRLEEIANAYHVYQQLLLENNALDFGDLINYTLKLFRQRPHILEKYRQQFKYILVDEFQDTNWAQYELIKLLAAPQNNLTVCADDDQSIYKFRGASISNVLCFKKDYPQTKEIVLIKNYRSKQNILDLAYKFIQLNNPNRLEWQLKDN